MGNKLCAARTCFLEVKLTALEFACSNIRSLSTNLFEQIKNPKSSVITNIGFLQLEPHGTRC